MSVKDKPEVECEEGERVISEKEEVKVSVETVPLVIEDNFCRRSMAFVYKTITMIFFCGTFSYFMANEPQPLSVLEALTYQVQFTPQNSIQTDVNSRGWFCFVFIL